MKQTLNTRLLLPEGKAVQSLKEYQQLGGLRGLQKARSMEPKAIIEEIKESGLRGRGGAGFPAWKKWETVCHHSCPTKYVCCNGAEGEPGTFKDRYLMRKNPYLVLEGLAIAIYVMGAKQGFVAIKKNFDAEFQNLERALNEMIRSGAIDNKSIEISFGPDDYLFGEEKGLMEVLEGRRAIPRQLPPYDDGLFRDASSPNPTLVNNVETLCNMPLILSYGSKWFRQLGVESSPGTMLFTLSGDVKKPGIYELPMGRPFQELIDEYGHGPSGTKPLRAAFSGVANPVLPREKFNTPLDFDSMKAAGSGLGSGGFIVYDESACLVKVAHIYSWFLSQESCGQCVSCKRGCEEITRVLKNLESGSASDKDLEEIKRQCDQIENGRLCYLAAEENLFIRGICNRYWDEFLGHVGKTCPLPREIKLPKMVDFDESKNEFLYDTKYVGKSLII